MMNKKVEYGILFCMYLVRAGRATVDGVAKQLKLKRQFLAQVAYFLHKKGVILSKKGPGGGYSLNGDPSVYQIIQALDPTKVKLSSPFMEGKHSLMAERRALHVFNNNLSAARERLLNRRISSVINELTANEVGMMNTINERVSVEN